MSGNQQPPTIPAENQKQEALAAFTATLHSVGTNLEQPLRDRAATITANEAALQRQEAELAEHTARLARQNASWAGLADETREGLKEIGDVQNWAEMIERDLLVLEEMMDGVEGEEDGEGSECGEDEMGRDGEVVNGHINGDGNGAVNGNGKGKGKKVNESKGWLRWW
ncbi:uncharacterized protein N7473_002646 [Penicillium subrubescens]|uniref:Biogenesis of lysosome-related organelles complex 1 subunit 1 n=1 Tax=Penicillium subrubescens TaxID=1316194 RepID=A0A1Q5UKQ2_9EURO|nr:uncharacterized protein N7473_002646 [Penicillium subrubescens]KAJ5905730.1 hypothetical protein N7473_002646 [Penicillium subrubescens]OKP13047.1 hypothetical protein PENSUB_1147 [Penicillium subrubescens]